MSEISATNRFLMLETPLGANKLVILKLSGIEEISRLPVFRLECGSVDPILSFDDIMGKSVTFAIENTDAEPRYFNGLVSRFSQIATEQQVALYEMEVVPWLWFLTRTSDCRIFQDMPVLAIIKKIFSEAGFQDFADRTQGTYQPRVYCTQYRESAFHFISRLMEEEGIFYFFEHTNGKHTMVLADTVSAIEDCPGQHEVRMQMGADVQTLDEDALFQWRSEHLYRSGAYQLQDYNFETPATALQVNATGLVNQGKNQEWQIYDYPGGYTVRGDGERYVSLRMDEEEVGHHTVTGEGMVRSFTAGKSFVVSEHRRSSENGSYSLTRVEHYAEQGGTWADLQLTPQYRNTFSAIPKGVRFRPQRLTQKPMIAGSQTAFVTGPPGEELYLDKYGRVKVQFHWDRRGEYDDKSSCWVRVAQIWTGKKWGAVFHPRIGEEVIVDFLEGDPDRPIITGRVFNASSMPPYALPDESTKSTIKSRSSKGGGGFNELRLEDKKGSEQFFLHAEKDMHERVKNDSFETILKDRHLIVQGEQFEKVSKNKHLNVGGDQNEKITGTFSRSSMTVHDKVSMSYAVEAGTEIHLKAGVNLVVEAGASLTLKVGGNFVNINSAGVFIQGTMVMINSGGAAMSGSGCHPDSPKDPKEADKAEPGDVSAPPSKKAPPRPPQFGPAATSLVKAAESGAPFCDI